MARLRLATANILHGMAVGPPAPDAGGSGLPRGEHDPADALRAAVAALDAEVIGLQEVDRNQLRSAGVDQTREAARAMGAQWWRFVPSVRGTPGSVRTWQPATPEDGSPDSDAPAYGVGLVSRLPVQRWVVRRFAAASLRLPLLVPDGSRPRLMLIPDEPRIAVAAVVSGPAGPFSVINAHLSFVPGFNARQLRAIVRWARAELPAPRFLIGDLNLPGSLPSQLSGWSQLVRAATYPAYAPRVQFDHVLSDGLGPWEVTSAVASAMAISDHRALVVDLVASGQADGQTED